VADHEDRLRGLKGVAMRRTAEPGHTGPAGALDALPGYTVRRSARACRVRLTVSAKDGLVVTLPPGVPEVVAARAVAERAAWAERVLAEVAERRAHFLAGPDGWLPDAVDLRALARTLPVRYEPAPACGGGATATARERDGVLVVTGAAGAPVRIAALRRWRDRTARRALPALLEQAAARAGVRPARVVVRGQRTRWGSCSARGTVSLNRNLVFLPPHLVDYVLAHELAHLTALDHSPRFWSTLESLVPDAWEARAELRGARHLVPVWADE